MASNQEKLFPEGLKSQIDMFPKNCSALKKEKKNFFWNVPALKPNSSVHTGIFLELLEELFSVICSFAK